MPLSPPAPEIIFYDGHCALCHRTVCFVLEHDRAGIAFRFAPLAGGAFEEKVCAAQRARMPDSMAVLRCDGSLALRSDAVVHILRRLGGAWRLAAACGSAVPGPLRDMLYDFVARIRYRLFGRRDDLCPPVPAELRSRFEL